MEIISPKLYSWASVLEEGTKEQALRSSRLEIIKPHIALMPDAHVGMGATVGSVIPTYQSIIPSAIGVDIGCGMIAVKTFFNKNDFTNEDLSVLRKAIERAVPSSAGGYNQTLTESAAARIADLLDDAEVDYSKFAQNWDLQLGTLGSGNHFIEVSFDETGVIWLFLHSGSRGIGNKIAVSHIKIAKAKCKDRVLEDPDLAYLEEGTREFDEYIRDLNWAQKFALLNREEMMDRVIKEVGAFLVDDVEEQLRINCHHNFTRLERHYDKFLWISRKGAISADLNEYGLVPGSMGTASYIVVGRGNKESYKSSPHGAGRVYGRKAARGVFTFDQLKEAMVGIEFNPLEDFVDEIPGAYKDISQVIQDSADLILPMHELHQLINVKGK